MVFLGVAVQNLDPAHRRQPWTWTQSASALQGGPCLLGTQVVAGGPGGPGGPGGGRGGGGGGPEEGIRMGFVGSQSPSSPLDAITDAVPGMGTWDGDGTVVRG